MSHRVSLTQLVGCSPAIAKTHSHKCILCIPPAPLKEQKIKWHLEAIHQTMHSTKCVMCSFKGGKDEIVSHYLNSHNKVEKREKAVKFIIPIHEDVPKEFVDQIKAEKKKSFAETVKNVVKRKREKAEAAANNKTNSKPSVTSPNLAQSLKSSVFLGPTSWSKKSDNASENVGKKIDDRKDSSSTKPTPVATTSSANSENTVTSRVVQHKQGHCRQLKFPLLKIRKIHARDGLPFFCFFCDELNTKDENIALLHIKEHIAFGFHCKYCNFMNQSLAVVNEHYGKKHLGELREYIDDKEVRRGDLNWMHDFLENQFKDSLYESEDEDEEVGAKGIECVLCSKAAKLDNDKAHCFKSLTEFKKHFKDHSRWFRVDCTNCGKTIKKTTKHLDGHADDHREIVDKSGLFNDRICEVVDEFIEKEISRKSEEYWNNLKAFHKCRECVVKPEKLDFSRLNFNLKNVAADNIPSVNKESKNNSKVTEHKKHKKESKSSKHKSETKVDSQIEPKKSKLEEVTVNKVKKSDKVDKREKDQKSEKIEKKNENREEKIGPKLESKQKNVESCEKKVEVNVTKTDRKDSKHLDNKSVSVASTSKDTSAESNSLKRRVSENREREENQKRSKMSELPVTNVRPLFVTPSSATKPKINEQITETRIRKIERRPKVEVSSTSIPAVNESITSEATVNNNNLSNNITTENAPNDISSTQKESSEVTNKNELQRLRDYRKPSEKNVSLSNSETSNVKESCEKLSSTTNCDVVENDPKVKPNTHENKVCSSESIRADASNTTVDSDQNTITENSTVSEIEKSESVNNNEETVSDGVNSNESSNGVSRNNDASSEADRTDDAVKVKSKSDNLPHQDSQTDTPIEAGQSSKPTRKQLEELKISLRQGWVGCANCGLPFESKAFKRHHRENHAGLPRHTVTPFIRQNDSAN